MSAINKVIHFFALKQSMVALLGTIYFAIYGKDLGTGASSKPIAGLMGLNK